MADARMTLTRLVSLTQRVGAKGASQFELPQLCKLNLSVSVLKFLTLFPVCVRKNAVFAREKVQVISPGAGLVIITASPIQQYNDANLFLTIRKTISNYGTDAPCTSRSPLTHSH